MDVLPFFAGDKDTPLWLNLACLLAPIGLGYAVWVAFRTGQEEQRAALRRVTDAEDGAPDPQIRMTDRSSHVTDR